ncbi:MAG TPA: bifunctional folylpolyglutamate synthase/dihydrofolate synthase [Lachnospiraceae bacterium]|nr:bifunctional folylpolyglutamate synthase/dihydrofolate synthase [Lachnospiraceae bacterium]
MDYQEARAFIAGKISGVHLELDRIRALLDELGNPEKNLRFLHIAGTNGKGSIAAYLSAALTRAGFCTGVYTSPVVYTYGEQFRINGKMITREEYTQLAEKMKSAVTHMERRGLVCPSNFELETVLAILFFAEQHCDYSILECGMGGRDDATNVIPAPVLAIFASISMDHTEFLGHTLPEIASVKAGIIKKGCMAAVTSGQQKETSDVLQSVCDSLGVLLVNGHPEQAEILENTIDGVTFRYKGLLFHTPLAGSCQVENAVTAFEALKVLQRKEPELTDEKILEGISLADWHGRFTRIAENPDFLVDGAHNPRAADILRKSVLECYPDRRRIFILGVFADKDYREVIRRTCDLADVLLCVETPDNERALPAEKLAGIAAEIFPGKPVFAEKSIPDAVRHSLALAGPEDLILSFGSLSNIGEITSLMKHLT